MIDDIRAFIENHRAAVPALADDVPYTVSTFHHGRANDASKVLFLIEAQGKPAAIGKVMRVASYGNLLRAEYAALEAAQKAGVHAPKPYALGLVQGFDFSLEEAIDGPVASAADALELSPAISTQLDRLPKLGTIATADLLAALGGQGSIVMRANELAKSVPTLIAAETHGDLTYRNIIRTAAGPALIDWSDYGRRPIQGIDHAHYLMRLSGKGDTLALAHAIRAHASDVFPTDMLELLALIDAHMDEAKKSDWTRYEALSESLRALIAAA